MTLIDAILKKVQTQDSLNKNHSPPPETEIVLFKKKRRVNKYAHVSAKVDSSPPRLDPSTDYRRLSHWWSRLFTIYMDNVKLLTMIRRIYILGGKVDSRWSVLPAETTQYRDTRLQFLKRIQCENKAIYRLIVNARSRVPPTSSLRRDWLRNREEIVRKSLGEFVLFPAVSRELLEDNAFAPPRGLKRPRAHLTLRLDNGATIGELIVELFTDVCPQTCQLFTELLDGDGLGHGYVGTHFFRKVPNLFWSGGDVIYDNGFGCYAQRDRLRPIGAENYHFSHSIPGLLSMRMTRDDEMCGIFNITFKPMPQFDLKNVVFGRVIRPSSTFDGIRSLGSALSVQPLVQVWAARRRDHHHHRWVHGMPNTRLARKSSP